MDNEDNAEQEKSEISNSYSLNSWMTDLYSSIKYFRIPELTLISAHNAGMDKKAPYTNSYDTCQDESFRHQMDNGVRVLDIRLMWYHGYGENNVNSGLRFHHSTTSGRIFENMMSDLDGFQAANPGEIIILDFHKFHTQRDDKDVPYAALHAHFMRHYINKMLPSSAQTLTLHQIKAQYPGPRIIVAAPNQIWSERPEGAPARDSTFFWSKIEHKWVGKDGQVSADEVERFLTGLMSSPPSNSSFWSASVTGYNAGGPMDLSQNIMRWYPPGGEWLKKSNIINFDWVSRSEFAFRRMIEINTLKPVSYKLERPTRLVVSKGPNSARISWTSRESFFEIYQSSYGGKSTANKFFDIPNLSPGQKYKFEVWAKDGVMESERATIEYTLEDEQSPIPRDFRVVENAKKVLKLAWEPPVGAGQVTGYWLNIPGRADAVHLTQTTHTQSMQVAGLPLIFTLRAQFAGGGLSDYARLVVTVID